MANLKVVGNAVVLISSIKLEDIEKVKKYRPDALTLKDEKGNPTFRVDVGSKPTANEFSVVFTGSTHDEDAKATATWVIATGLDENVKEELADMYGSALLKLKKFEEDFPAVIRDVNGERESVLDQIDLA